MPRAAAVPSKRSDTATPTIPSRKDDITTFATPKHKAPVVPIQDPRDAPEGYREITVRALRDGYYEHKRRKGPRGDGVGVTFTMALVGPGDLPDWVELVHDD